MNPTGRNPWGLPAFGSLALVEAATRGLFNPAGAERIIHAILDLGVWSPALDPDVYVDVARRAGFDADRCGRSLLADEALPRADPRFIQNARLLAAVAGEAPALLERWASAIVTSYAEILEIEPLVSSSLLIAGQLDPDTAKVSDEVRARNARVIAALRAAAGHEPGKPDSDPLEAGLVRWLRVVSEADQRTARLDRLLAQIASEDADALHERLASLAAGAGCGRSLRSRPRRPIPSNRAPGCGDRRPRPPPRRSAVGALTAAAPESARRPFATPARRCAAVSARRRPLAGVRRTSTAGSEGERRVQVVRTGPVGHREALSAPRYGRLWAWFGHVSPGRDAVGLPPGTCRGERRGTRPPRMR